MTLNHDLEEIYLTRRLEYLRKRKAILDPVGIVHSDQIVADTVKMLDIEYQDVCETSALCRILARFAEQEDGHR